MDTDHITRLERIRDEVGGHSDNKRNTTDIIVDIQKSPRGHSNDVGAGPLQTLLPHSHGNQPANT
jgi:hypothetical protein